MIKFIKRFQNIIAIFIIVLLIVIGFRLTPHPPLSESLSFSTTFYDENGKLMRITLADDQQYRLWTPLEKISPHLINGLLLHEDQWFYYHAGFNPISLTRAFWATYVGGGNRQGASTITMQLARMYWKINTKTISGKLLQIFKAIQLELMYSKHDILEAYFNYAPFGRNIESIGAASLIYFDKTPDKINLPEALTLTVLPQSPTYRIDKKTGIAGKALLNARQRLLERWQNHFSIDDNIVALFGLPLVMRQPEQLPFIAPHFTNQILQQLPYSQYEQHQINTTLNADLQNIIEQQVSAFIERNKNKGIYNASVLLVDNKTMEVKALIGSANYFNASIHGQVNGTQAKRSPGSTLKPFIYALGIDQSIIHPRTILKDVETDFGFYTPENFDRNFKGPISVTDALIHSRNIPAVYVAGKLKRPSFYQFLKQAKISDMASEEHYGLALVLGGGEVTPQELATLYAMLPNKGLWQPLKFIQNLNETDSTLKPQLLSPEASFMTLDMLLKNTRQQDILIKKQQSMTPVYWKTGTSWGFRDAWTAGGFSNYTLVVWLGNFDGSSNNAFIGVNAATPLFFNIIDAITAYYPKHKQYNSVAIPSNLIQVEICLPSGNLVTKWCKMKGKTWFIPGVSPINVDTIYRPVMINNKTNDVACPPYNPQTSHIEVFEYWPSDLAKVFAKAGMPKKQPPDTTHCDNSQSFLGDPPRITSPLKNVVYKLRIDNQNNEKIILNATADGEVKELYWFIDNHFLSSTTTNTSIDWVPYKSGIYKVSVIDDLGRSDSRTLNVDLIQ